MPCKSSHSSPQLELKTRILEKTGPQTEPDTHLNFETETGTNRGDLWYPLVQWLLSKKHLKGVRVIIRAMDLWAESAIFDNHNFDLSHLKESEGVPSLEYPVFEEQLDMTDQKTLSDCRKRLEHLERQGRYNGLKDSEKEELRQIRKYLGETTHNGRIKKFPSGLTKLNKGNREAVKYALKKLEREEPALAEYAKQHLCLRDFVKWKD